MCLCGFPFKSWRGESVAATLQGALNVASVPTSARAPWWPLLALRGRPPGSQSPPFCRSPSQALLISNFSNPSA